MLYVLKKVKKLDKWRTKEELAYTADKEMHLTSPKHYQKHLADVGLVVFQSVVLDSLSNTGNYECIKYGQILVSHVHLDCMDVILKNEVSDPQCTVPTLRTYMCQKKHTTEHYESLWVIEWPPRSSDLKINGAARDHFTDKDSQHPKRALECPSGSLDSYCWTLKETALMFA